jgi:transposase InsO family protein
VRLYPFIEAEKSQHGNVKRACELLEVSRSAYYAARQGSPSQRAAEDAEPGKGWLYLATVIGIASRRFIGYALAGHLRTELVGDALSNAVAARDPRPGVIFHSGRGCQHTSAAYAALAEQNQVTLSVGRTGQCRDNASAESFFSSLKGELADTRAWPSRAGARRAVVEYIAWYNGTRLHSSLGYQSPADYENDHRENIKRVA